MPDRALPERIVSLHRGARDRDQILPCRQPAQVNAREKPSAKPAVRLKHIRTAFAPQNDKSLAQQPRLAVALQSPVNNEPVVLPPDNREIRRQLSHGLK